MLAELSRDRGSGLLGFRTLWGAGGPTVVQYWDSHEKLYAYASASGAEYRPASAEFNRRARKVPARWGSGTRPSSSTAPNRSDGAVPTMGRAPRRATSRRSAATPPAPGSRERPTARRRLATVAHVAQCADVSDNDSRKWATARSPWSGPDRCGRHRRRPRRRRVCRCGSSAGARSSASTALTTPRRRRHTLRTMTQR